ncbi:DUF4394 domain-containing protein [Azospirillum sp. SYSU D00513]|uniref:DUF4394 domain-containing protein n=1 Tax=Azospirillum sp. SYSU D00513 TaxID=2812561 RepID=UPI001A963004|nr:DUF4394 domain-containing protein [Azospirillum sp. SYSU D00513]
MKSMILAAVAALALTAPAHADTLAALAGSSRIAMIDTGSMTIGRIMTLNGTDSEIVGIDVRPADGMLYGLSRNGTLYAIDTRAGTVMRKSALSVMPAAGARVTVDFNPVADRLRVMGSDGTNLRVNVDDGMTTKDGMLRYADADTNRGMTPSIAAGAYTNSMKGAKETALFDLDAASGLLVKQAPPNDGILGTVGKLGVTGSGMAFDIANETAGDGAMRNVGWLLTGGTLHRIDLATGQAKSVGKVTGATDEFMDIAVLPAAR